MKIGIIGYGLIGSELLKRALERNWKVGVVARTSGVYTPAGEKIAELSNWLEYFQRLDVVVLCISTKDDGKEAYDYIRRLVENRIPVVTSEKGALGNYFPELKPWINKIGYSATVGGGTQLLHWLKGRLSSMTKEVHLVINATLNYIFDGLSRGRALDELVDESKKLGYAEPGAQDALNVINTEACRDIPMKISTLLNICGFGEIRAKEINVLPVTDNDLKRLVREASMRRYIVSITKETDEEDVVGGFKFKLGEWYISGGFKNQTHNPLFRQLIPPGVNNAALVYGIDGTYILTGPGAGATPTVLGGLMKDIEKFLKLRGE